jgi:hypothetical protein
LEAVHTDDGGDDTSCDCERDKYDISEAGWAVVWVPTMVSVSMLFVAISLL